MKTRLHQWTKLTVLLLVTLAVTATAENKVWKPLPPLPYIGTINDIALGADGSLYAVALNQVYRSTDNDKTWIPMGEGAFWGTISDIATDPKNPNVIVVSTDTQVFWTTNGGASWNSQRFEVNPHTGLGGGAGSVKVHPSFKTIFADSYLLRMDGAWQRVIPDKWVSGFVFPNDGSVLGISDGNPADIVRSVNGGQSWKTVGSVPGSGLLYLGKDNRIYGVFTGSETGIPHTYPTMYSDDLGATWTDIEIGFEGLPAQDVPLMLLGIDTTNNRIYTSVANPEYGYAKGIYYSDDNMRTWKLLDPALENIEPAEIVLANDGRIFIATMSDGVLEYNPLSNEPVSERNNGILSHVSNTITITRKNVMIVHGRKGIQISHDGGQSWRHSRPGMTSSISSLIDLPSGDIFAGTTGATDPQHTYTRPPLYRSTDGGDSWTPLGEELISPNADRTEITALFADKNNRLYATTRVSSDTLMPYALYTSADNGTHWQQIPGVLSTTVVTPSGIIYTVGMNPSFTFDFLRSSDLGVTWDILTPPFGISFDSNPVLIPGLDNILYFYAQGTGGFSSYDNGVTWGTETYQHFHVYFDRIENAYRAYNDKTVYFIDRTAGNHIDISTGLSMSETVSIVNIDFDMNNVPFAALSDGQIFTYVKVAATDVDEPTPGSATSTAYPNPFTDMVTIRYSLPTAAPVTLTVTDIPGRVVRTLQLPPQQAGDQTLSFEGNTLAPGLYIYTIIAGSSVQTGTIIRR